MGLKNNCHNLSLHGIYMTGHMFQSSVMAFQRTFSRIESITVSQSKDRIAKVKVNGLVPSGISLVSDRWFLKK